MARATAGQHRRARASHRVLTVAVSAAATIALGVGYVVADAYDVLPGPLTVRGVAAPQVPKAGRSLSSGGLVADADLSIPVDADEANALIDAFAASSGVGADYSVVVADADGTVAAQRNADAAREPASTLKTLTSLAATATLDMASTLDTSTYLVQNADGSATVVLSGGGDMLLGAGDGDPDHVNGRAGLGTLAERTAEALAQRGITAVTLLYDDSLFGDSRYPAGIEENNPGNLYYTGIASMAVDGGRRWADPPDDPDTYTAYPELSTQPAADAAATFAARLAERGITVAGEPAAGATPAGMSPIATVSSAQLSEIMAFMLRHSDNTLAEEFGRLVALATGHDNSPAGATQAVTAALEDLGVDTAALSMADCSGLAPGSRLTASILVEVQALALGGDVGAGMLEGMSVPGLTGTAAGRLADDDAAGLLRVKTGTLDAVTAMTGNVSRRDGGVLAFAIIVNDPENAWEAARAVDVFIAGLAGL